MGSTFVEILFKKLQNTQTPPHNKKNNNNTGTDVNIIQPGRHTNYIP